MRPLFQLDARLQMCADFVPPGAVLADIGTDHAYLPVWLCKSGKIPKAIAADIGQGPLQSAGESIARYQAQDRIETRLSDGLAAFSPGEADTIVIAGMGGELIARILGAAPWVKNPSITLILQPMTAVRELRLFLWENGFRVESETCCRDGRHVYTAMKVRFSGEEAVMPPVFPFAGAIAGKTEAERAFLQREKVRLEKECRGARCRGEQERERVLQKAIAGLRAILGEEEPCTP